jgi:hypothetical protein
MFVNYQKNNFYVKCFKIDGNQLSKREIYKESYIIDKEKFKKIYPMKTNLKK